MKHLPLLIAAVACLFSSCSSKEEFTQQDALDFLYAYMPLPDKVDYDSAFYQRNIETTFQARAEMPWGKSVPLREFKHFVLPVRVNNENMDESRMVFYAELKDRVKGLSMKEAILEVNHWCHEKVTYTPSDERTSSPLASIRTAYGRCGEESTFTVAALRSVGIPARQVYTPRWAHTDDNHAWVEAWADGEWHFLGACEPEPVLNLGWFNAPASRGMLMHTKAFGAYDGPEEVMSQTACYTEIDVTQNYAPINRRVVRVVDADGKPAAGAHVQFKIYNYAEFYTVSDKVTDAEGLTYMQSGKGDLLAWAYNDGVYGFTKCDMSLADTLTVVMDRRVGSESFSADLLVTPPSERNTIPDVSDEMRTINNMRLAQEDSIRNAYIATFPQSDDELIVKSCGNYEVIQEFLQAQLDGISPRLFLATLSDKDLRDVTPDVLHASVTDVPANTRSYPEDIYYRYVLSPRIANEGLTPFQPVLRAALHFENVEDVIKWTRDNIRICETSNPQHLRMSPIGVLRNRECDAFSRNIFFVALMRSQGMAARIDAVTQAVEYYADGKWIAVRFGEESDVKDVAEKSLIRATFSPDEYNTNPKYYSHFTLSRLNNGVPELMNYAEDDTYQTTLQKGVQLNAGEYMLTTGTRLADGSALVHIEVASVAPSQTLTLPLVMRKSEESLQVIGSFNSENLYNDNADGVKSLLSTTGRGYYIVAVIAPNNEPTNHVLRDISLCKDEFEAWGRKIVLIFRNQSEADRFNPADFPDLPSTVVFGVDSEGQILPEMQGTLPVVKVADTFNRVVFKSEGYTIGLGETLVKTLRKL